MRLRLSDAATFAFLAEHYNTQAEVCLQLARATISPVKDSWLELCRRVDEAGARDRRESCAGTEIGPLPTH